VDENLQKRVWEKKDFSPIGVIGFFAEGRKILKGNHQGFLLRSERRARTAHTYRTFRSSGGGSDDEALNSG